MSMTTELAQRMKAAAIRAKAATEDYVAHRMSITTCLSECEEFNTLSDSPDNIIALVEALEAMTTTAQLSLERTVELETALEEAQQPTTAATDVLAERQRQMSAEGWAPEHDDEHDNGQLASAASCYALFADAQGFSVPAHWPWSGSWWKQSGQRRDLVKAGALILAEIERLDRAAGISIKGSE